VAFTDSLPLTAASKVSDRELSAAESLGGNVVKSRISIGVLSGLAAMLPGALHAAPAGMLNKTVTVSYETSIPAKTLGGEPRNARRNVNKVMYISSAGRIFTRSVRRAAPGGDTVETAPGGSDGAPHIEGNTIVSTVKAFTGATRLVVSFDSSFSSCTATVISGRENGNFVWKSLNKGETYIATGPTQVSTPSCSVQSGNAFAGQ